MNIPASFIWALVWGGIFSAFCVLFCTHRQLAILQQEGYSERAFLKWCFRKGNLEGRRLSLLSLALALLTALFNICFCFLGHGIANLISLVPFAGLCVLYYFSEQKRALKVPLKSTPRLIRLSIVFALLFMAFSCGLGFACTAVDLAVGSEWYSLFRFVWFALLPLSAPFILAGAGVLARAYEAPHSRRIVKNASKKLADSPCIKVGITGSFGKTSVKNFACAMLSRKYRVIATPASYNTPLGIARTVNEQGVDCDIFLAEMGARRTGDIKELCRLVQPTVGLVTGVTCQHLETFGSMEAIRAEKRELALTAKCCVLGGTAVDFCETASKEGQDFSAEEIVLSEEGVAFTLRLGEKRLPVKLPLYGRQTAQNVALAGALCLELGMTAEEIAEAVKDIQPVPHRLEKREGNGLHILDDSYNSNAEGAKNAIEALRAFSGKKCVITPGLVELGDLEEEKNAELGGLLAGLDLVVLVGETRVLSVRRGYLQAGGEEERLFIVPTLQDAVAKLTALSAGDCVLFLNDLPDKY